MWKHHTAMLALIVTLCHSMPVNAQDTAAHSFPEKWSLQDCLDYALKNNITINTARLNQRQADQDLLLARAGVLPNLTGNASDYLTFQKRINSSGNYGNRGFSESGNYSLNSAVTIYQGGYVRNTIREKQLYQQAAGLDILQSENDITLNVTQDFLNILLARENIVYFQDLLNTSQSQVDQAKQKYNVGSIALKDLVELQAQTANDKYSLVTAQNTHRQNIIALKLLLQLPSEVPFQALEPDTLIAKNAVTGLTATQQEALSIRPEIKLSDRQVDIARTDLQLARSNYLPVLQGTGAIGASHAGGDPGVFQQLDNAFYQQIGLTLSVPIFTRRAARTSVEKAKIEVEQTELNRKNTRNNLELTIEQAYVNVENAQGQYDASVEQVQYTKEAYRIANEQLKVGAITTVDYLIQRNLYTQAYQQYIQAKYNAALTIRIYDFYRGVPVKL